MFSSLVGVSVMDASDATVISLFAGGIGVFLVAFFFKDAIYRATFALIIALSMGILVGVFNSENTKGTPADLKIGTSYTYQVEEWFSTNSTLQRYAVARMWDQDREIAYYQFDCTRIRGRCESVPKDGIKFQIVSGGTDLVIVPIQPKSKEK